MHFGLPILSLALLFEVDGERPDLQLACPQSEV
jgi:hypothetical protein